MVAVDETCNYFKTFHPRFDTNVSATLIRGNVCLFSFMTIMSYTHILL